MDTSRLERGELIAGVSGVVLLITMFLFSWFEVPGELGELADVAGVDTGFNAWQSFDFIDLVLFVTVVAAIGIAVEKAMGIGANLPVAGSALVAGLGILSLVLVGYRVLDPPEDLDRAIGLWIGLLAVIGIVYGGWMGMQEEGTSFSGEADRLSSRDDAPPPPPPPAGGGTGAPPTA